MTEAPITTTLKAPGANAPWMVIRSENTVQLAQQLGEIQANTTFADLARANEAFAAHFTVGAVLGGRGASAPADTGAFAQAPAPAAAPAPQYQQEYQAPAPAQQQYAAPAPAAAPAYGGGAAATPGAPMVAGMPAKLISGASAKGPWQAWADPRPKEATDHMQKTEDVNHPGLAGGTHKLWKWIR